MIERLPEFESQLYLFCDLEHFLNLAAFIFSSLKKRQYWSQRVAVKMK